MKYCNIPDIKGALKTAKKAKSKNLVVITKETEDKRTIEGIDVVYVPAWKFLLMPV